MSDRLKVQSNEAWLAVLRGEAESADASLEALGNYLNRNLRVVLRQYGHLTDQDYADLTQETLLKIVEKLDTFRGDSAFTTWATAIATRVAFTEIRKRSVRSRGDDQFKQIRQQALKSQSPDTLAHANEVFGMLSEIIERELTDRQKIAILSELRGVPSVEIAKQLNSNRNALYKLGHDARKKMRSALMTAGVSSAAMGELVSGTQPNELH